MLTQNEAQSLKDKVWYLSLNELCAQGMWKGDKIYVFMTTYLLYLQNIQEGMGSKKMIKWTKVD